MKRVLAVDPGSKSMGLALVELTGRRLQLLKGWTLAPKKDDALGVRLRQIYRQLPAVMTEALALGAEGLAVEEPPAVWKTAEGRERNAHSPFVIGLAAGPVLYAWWSVAPEALPAGLVQVRNWREVLNPGLKSLVSRGDWKAAAVLLASALLGKSRQIDGLNGDLAEAILLGYACLQEPGLLRGARLDGAASPWRPDGFGVGLKPRTRGR